MKSISASSLSLAALTLPQAASGASLIGLGDLPGGEFSSTAYGVSDDGRIVIGYSNRASGYEAFRWTASTGMVGIGKLPGVEGNYSGAQAISGDGTTIVGYSSGPGVNEAFR